MPPSFEVPDRLGCRAEVVRGARHVQPAGRGRFEELGLELAPRYLGVDDQGREMFSYLDGEVPEELRGKRGMLHVVITGCNAKKALIDLADLVTAMQLVKHPCKAGTKAQRGVEFYMTPARRRGGYGSRDCEGTRAYY